MRSFECTLGRVSVVSCQTELVDVSEPLISLGWGVRWVIVGPVADLFPAAPLLKAFDRHLTHAKGVVSPMIFRPIVWSSWRVGLACNDAEKSGKMLSLAFEFSCRAANQDSILTFSVGGPDPVRRVVQIYLPTSFCQCIPAYR